MAIDFIRTPGPEHHPKPKLDFWKPIENSEEEYFRDKAKLEEDKAAFEKEKRLAIADSIEKRFLEDTQKRAMLEEEEGIILKKKRGRPPVKKVENESL